MKRRSITTDDSFQNLPIMTDADRGLFADARILEKIKAQFDFAEKSKTKTFFMRYDVRYPADWTEIPSNHRFSNFQASLMKSLVRGGLKPQYLAVREQSREKHQHYHACLWLDGQKTRRISDHIHTAERLWASTLGLPAEEGGRGLIDDCTRSRGGEIQTNGVLLCPKDPNYEAKRAECFYRASYLAKVNTKKTPAGQRELFASRLRQPTTQDSGRVLKKP